MLEVWDKSFEKKLNDFLVEDGLDRMGFSLIQHPSDVIKTHIKWKSKLLVAGMPLVCALIEQFNKNEKYEFKDYKSALMALEGQWVKAGDLTEIDLPFSVFIFLERTLLNLLHRLSAIATTTSEYVSLARPYGIEILDTRKTTPGLRSFERYAVSLAGGKNHRNDLTDALMIKDNQKKFFGSLKKAWEYYSKKKSFYQVVIVEIHSLAELKEAIDLGIKHVMLDNFSTIDIHKAIELKTQNMTLEISGGVTLENMNQYLIKGIDAISLSSITFWPKRVDISWKIA
jgi:nicotinate-nucleotide pyrophosphorylase (carboxylating)